MQENAMYGQDLNNFRPISDLNFLSKVDEKIIVCRPRSRLKKHLLKYNIITTFQHGFTKGRSVETANNQYVQNVLQALDNGHV